MFEIKWLYVHTRKEDFVFVVHPSQKEKRNRAANKENSAVEPREELMKDK